MQNIQLAVVVCAVAHVPTWAFFCQLTKEAHHLFDKPTPLKNGRDTKEATAVKIRVIEFVGRCFTPGFVVIVKLNATHIIASSP